MDWILPTGVTVTVTAAVALPRGSSSRRCVSGRRRWRHGLRSARGRQVIRGSVRSFDRDLGRIRRSNSQRGRIAGDKSDWIRRDGHSRRRIRTHSHHCHRRGATAGTRGRRSVDCCLGRTHRLRSSAGRQRVGSCRRFRKSSPGSRCWPLPSAWMNRRE